MLSLMLRSCLWAVGGVALGAGVASAQPLTAFDNLGADGAYDTSVSWVVNGPDVEYADERIAHGMRFTAERSGRVERIDLGIGWISGINRAAVQLWSADASTGALGEKLFTWVVEGAVPGYGLDREATPFESEGPGPMIEAGTSYWVVPRASLDTDFGWYWSADDSLTAPIVNLRPGGVENYSTDRQGAMRVVVPSPGVVGVFAAAGLIGVRRRR